MNYTTGILNATMAHTTTPQPLVGPWKVGPPMAVLDVWTLKPNYPIYIVQGTIITIANLIVLIPVLINCGFYVENLMFQRINFYLKTHSSYVVNASTQLRAVYKFFPKIPNSFRSFAMGR
jgi:hypothetical protein